MKQLEAPVKTAELAKIFNCSRVTAWRICRDNIGLAWKFADTFVVPQEHIERIKRGETPAQIAASYRLHEQEAA
jgi:hypothetical protein